MSVICMAAQRLGSTLRLPLANLSDMDKPVGDYRIDGIERIVLNPSKSDETTFVPIDRDIERENAKLRELCKGFVAVADESSDYQVRGYVKGLRGYLRKLGVEVDE